MKVKFCQFDLWILYCTSVVLSGKLFRIKTCLWLKSISVYLLSKSSQLVALFSRWRFYLLPLITLGGRIKGVQCSLLYRSGHTTLGWGSHESSQHACIPWYASVPAWHVDCISLQSAWVKLSLAAVIKKTTLALLRISPLDWTYFWLKTATFKILINELPPELSLFAACRATQLASRETWAWRYQFNIGRLNALAPTEYSYSNAIPALEWNIVQCVYLIPSSSFSN